MHTLVALATAGSDAVLWEWVRFILIAAFVVLLPAIVFWLWGVIDAARRPGHAWQAVGHSRALWLVGMFFFGAFATLAYAIWMRPMLRKAEAGWDPDEQVVGGHQYLR